MATIIPLYARRRDDWCEGSLLGVLFLTLVALAAWGWVMVDTVLGWLR